MSDRSGNLQAKGYGRKCLKEKGIFQEISIESRTQFQRTSTETSTHGLKWERLIIDKLDDNRLIKKLVFFFQKEETCSKVSAKIFYFFYTRIS